MSFRKKVKGMVEAVPTTGGLTRLNRHRHRTDTIIVAYHNVLPDRSQPAGDRSLHLAHEKFVAQLDRLVRTHEVVPLSELLPPHPKTQRPQAAITLDDAYHGVVELAVPELKGGGLPPTVFVAPGLLGDRSFWWALLADPDAGVVPDGVRQRSLTDHKGIHQAVLSSERPRVESMPPYARSATAGELLKAAERTRLVLASHTWSHPNLTALHGDGICAELRPARSWLTDHVSTPFLGLAYPYGLFDGRVESAVRLECPAAFMLRGGWFRRSAVHITLHRIPRVNISAGVSLRGFELRTSDLIAR